MGYRKGATHYTHWFQPLTGVTAEKHDSFITPTANGKVLMEFSGKELVRGEPDASSFPSGGLRATFEARGYTAWDPTAFAFVKDGSLYIPTCFFSYTGAALDKKTPLLRSIDEVSREAVRILRLFGDHSTKRVIASVGPEQEYFLIAKEDFARRKDLRLTGRTLFGAPPPKGQELDDHYFGAIRPRVSAYMRDLDEALWRLGILSKTKHNEVAPAQHEMAPIYTDANTACDANQLVMEIMKKPPKSMAWSVCSMKSPLTASTARASTTTGLCVPTREKISLSQAAHPVKTHNSWCFSLRLSKAWMSIKTGSVAPSPPPVTITAWAPTKRLRPWCPSSWATNWKPWWNPLLTAPTTDLEKSVMRIGVDVLPSISKDTTDRNRTSPLAFTGNKFEFRMLGSSQSVSGPNIALNTIMAEELKWFADQLEQSADFDADLQKLICQALTEHRRIIFNGNGYDESWVREAEQRGLSNLRSTAECMPAYISQKISIWSHGTAFSQRQSSGPGMRFIWKAIVSCCI